MDTLEPFEFELDPPVKTVKEEQRELRSAANFAGLFMLAMVVSFQFASPIIMLFLQMIGFVDARNAGVAYLGLGNTTYLLVYSVIYIVAMGAPLLLLLSKKGFNPFAPIKRVHLGVGFFGYVSAVGVCMLANVITSIILNFLSQHGIEASPPPQLMEPSMISFVLNLFVIAVLPAVLEELVFRGCVLRLLRPYGDLFAVIISAVLFGLMHGNLRQIPFATIVGIVLGWLYVVTNNIWLPILVHFTNNAISVVTEYVSFWLTKEQTNVMNVTLIVRLIEVGIVALLTLVIFFRHRLKMGKTTTNLSFWRRGQSAITSPALMGSVVLFILLMLLEM